MEREICQQDMNKIFRFFFTLDAFFQFVGHENVTNTHVECFGFAFLILSASHRRYNSRRNSSSMLLLGNYLSE